MYENICCYCMEDTGGKDPCPYCGTYLSYQNSPPALPTRMVLDNKYLLGRSLGKGGFGITYLGYDLKLKRRVALKEFLPKMIADRAADQCEVVTFSPEDIGQYEYGLEKFLEEARTLARFEHPNIVQVRHFFNENNTAYFEMAYLQGKTLEEYIRQFPGGITEAELLKIILLILEGLKKVHEANILHRDIKPSNIYIPKDRDPLLLDFGSARQAMMNKNQRLSVFLTHGYAPPEQYTSNPLQGPYTDIYACAATMYTCLRNTYNKGKLVPLLSAPDRQNGEELPPIEKVSQQKVSPHVAKAIMKGLELQKEQRPQSVAEFQDLLNPEKRKPSILYDIFDRSKRKPTPFQDILNISVQPKAFELSILAGEFAGEKLPLSSKPIVMGRSSKSTLVLSDEAISSTHCQVSLIDGIVYVKDLQSRNGTYINGKRLQRGETVQVKSGDIVSLAGCVPFEIIGTEIQDQEKYPSEIPQALTDYAGFWKRIWAAIIDLFSALLALTIAFTAGFGGLVLFGYAPPEARRLTFGYILPESGITRDQVVVYLILTSLFWLYWTLGERFSHQATPGKAALKIIVTDTQGNRLSFLRAAVRNLLKILPVLVVLVGNLVEKIQLNADTFIWLGLSTGILIAVAGFTPKKRALRDIIAGCLVLNKTNK